MPRTVTDLLVALVALVVLGSSAPRAPAGPGDPTDRNRADREQADYTKLRAARDGALRAQEPQVFVAPARAFLEAYPDSERAGLVRLWIGDALATTQPREAYAAYAASAVPAARASARRLAVLHEAPPPLDVERWVGEDFEPGREGRVTVLAFLSWSHPQTGRALPHLIRLHERYADRGLRVAAVATVIDDHANQRPDALEARVRRERLPFPVAIDKQRAGAPSVSFDTYLGRSLPWMVLFDRYGRIAWMGGPSPTAGALGGCRARLEHLLDDPSFDAMTERVMAGDAAALDRLGRIRTKETVTALLTMLGREPEPELRRALARTLRGLAPSHYCYDPNALQRWELEHRKYRYSLAQDRLVPR